MNTVLIFGVLLIVAGIALAILAYALILNRRGETPGGEEPEEREADFVVPPPAPPPAPSAEPASTLSPPPAPSQEQPIVPPPLAPPPAQAVAPTAAPPPPRTIDVARLLRDEVTGSLLIGVGTRLYRTADELRDSADWLRMESAARDLQVWFAARPRTMAVEERRSVEAVKRAGSMLDQINAILERKLALAPELPQGVRLAPSPEGGVRVLIGLQAYPLDQVPDAKINQLIRESVSEWENQG